MKKTTVLAGLMLAGALVTGALVTTPASAKPGAFDRHDQKKLARSGPVAIGDTAPAFELKDTAGQTVKLESYKGKIVVLEWFNPECPFIKKHHVENHTFNDLHQQYSSKGVVFLAINSAGPGLQGGGKDANAKAKADYKIPYPILLDEDGRVGRAYGAKTTPDCFVIDKDGKLVYKGAIDNNSSAKTLGNKNYVKEALDSVLAGKKVEDSDTRPYGCAVKYAQQ